MFIVVVGVGGTGVYPSGVVEKRRTRKTMVTGRQSRDIIEDLRPLGSRNTDNEGERQ